MHTKLKTFVLIILIAIVSGAVYCYFNYQFWTHLRTDNFEALTEYESKNIRGFRGRQILIHKNFRPYMQRIDRYAKENGIKLIINQSYRNSKQNVRRTIVKPVQLSNHKAGFAIDFNIKFEGKKYFAKDLNRKNLGKQPKQIQDFIQAIRDDKELRWGGDFRNQDPVHIDYPLNLKNKERWLEYSKACSQDYSNAIPKWKIWK